MQDSQNVIFRIGFDSVIEHNIFEILPANIEENHQFCRYWNATAAIQRISRAAHTKDRCCCHRCIFPYCKPPCIILNSIVPSGFEVNQPAEVAVVAGGYKMATEFPKTLRIA